MSIGFSGVFNDTEKSVLFTTGGRNAKTISESVYQSFNLTGEIVGEKLFDGNYVHVETHLKNVGETGASIWKLRIGKEYEIFKKEFLGLIEGFFAYECKIRYDSIKYGCNYLNALKNEYFTLNASGALAGNELLMREVDYVLFSLILRLQ